MIVILYISVMTFEAFATRPNPIVTKIALPM